MQGRLLKEYPSKLLNAMLQSIFATLQSLIVALLLQRNFSRWKLGFDIILLTIVYIVSAPVLFKYLIYELCSTSTTHFINSLA